MFCSKCGQAVEDGVNFCPKCGNNLSQKTEIAGQVVNERKQEVTQVVMVMPTGTAPLVMGLLGMFGSFIPVVKYFTGLLSLLALFVGASQRKRLINAGLPSGKATAGMVLGLIAVLITVISIAMAGMFIKSLIGSSKPTRATSIARPVVSSSAATVNTVVSNNLDGTWVGGDKIIDQYMYIFSGSSYTLMERNGSIYENREKGYFTINDGYRVEFIVNATHRWRNDSWVEVDLKAVWYISDRTNYSFTLRDHALLVDSSWVETYRKRADYDTWASQQNENQQDKPIYPSGFMGTWKRDNFNNILTFTETTLNVSNQLPFRILSGVSGDSYTFYQDDDPSYINTLTIKLVNGNLEINGASGSGEDNWNGTWKRTFIDFTNFIGTWKRDNYRNTLTFDKNTVKASNQPGYWILSDVSGDSYTFHQENRVSNTYTITIKLVNGNIEIITGSSENVENNWNGTWKKQ